MRSLRAMNIIIPEAFIFIYNRVHLRDIRYERDTEEKFLAPFAKSAIYQRDCALYGDVLFRSFVAADDDDDDDDDNVAFARGFVSFIHTFLVGELIRPRQGEAGRSGTDARLYRVGGLAARKPNLLFYGARICSNLQRLGTPLYSGEKKGPRAARFFTSFFFAEEKKFPSVHSLWRILFASRPNNTGVTEKARENGEDEKLRIINRIRESYCVYNRSLIALA